jgi:hypothetical protein
MPLLPHELTVGSEIGCGVIAGWGVELSGVMGRETAGNDCKLDVARSIEDMPDHVTSVAPSTRSARST